jgi:hypothetical protein
MQLERATFRERGASESRRMRHERNHHDDIRSEEFFGY